MRYYNRSILSGERRKRIGREIVGETGGLGERRREERNGRMAGGIRKYGWRMSYGKGKRSKVITVINLLSIHKDN